MIKKLITLSLLASPYLCAAAPLEASPYYEAIHKGSSTKPMVNDVLFSKAVTQLQKSTGSSEPLSVKFKLITRFEDQPNCGRIAMYPYQEATNTAWGTLGGELNICDDGLPVLMVCVEKPKALVPPDTKCAKGTAPINSAEVQKAIDESVKRGGLTQDQVNAKMIEKSKGEKSSK